MQGVSLIWLEVVLGFIVPIGWAVWQLVDLRRERALDRLTAARLAGAESAPRVDDAAG